MLNFCFKLNLCTMMVFLFLLPILAQDEKSLVRIEEDGKYGYANLDGKIIAEPKFDFAEEEFSDGVAWISVKKKFGIINLNGQIIMLQNDFIEVKSFSEGVAAVAVKIENKAKWGFVNKNGVFVINPIYDAAQDFSEGLAVVGQVQEPIINEPVTSESGNKIKYFEYGYIDKDGKLAIPFQFYFAKNFKDGSAVVYEPLFNTLALIDKKGRIAQRIDGESLNPNELKTNKYAIDSAGNENITEILLGAENNYPTVLELTFVTTRRGAVVYLIPLLDWDKDKQIYNNPEKLSKYKIPTGTTPTKVKVKEIVYMAVFEKDGKKSAPLRADVRLNPRIKGDF